MYASKETMMQRDLKALQATGTKAKVLKDNETIVTGEVQSFDRFVVRLKIADKSAIDAIPLNEVKDYKAMPAILAEC